MGALDGRTALVTGGGRGLGAAVAAELAAHGAHVGVLSRTADDVRRVAAEIGGTALVADVADRDRLSSVLQRFGEADVVVANAGVVWPLGTFAGVDLAEWEAAVEVNLFGAVRVVRAFVPGMVARGYGRIVTISSGAANPPGMPSANAYSASKAALDMATLHLARELSGTGVTANAVRPGVVDTDMQTFMRGHPADVVGVEFYERFHGLHERGELVAPSTAAAFVVGVVLGDGNGEVLDIRTSR
ncbi:MAG: meso-butanediol dehydrogenase / (S,S)-butanediol dehydrogenase / diacetyl reductase [Frankiaceae bacterium]|jgi:NAD(P)-dependent dehydrogenase (short-subunit alcohol dehydrogenase family)|nr:meso-butanediol dehydrogenase / (S,S)-butanediol dehydrogenase / diacetyl reductase [Frankiaceae bacterium]